MGARVICHLPMDFCQLSFQNKIPLDSWDELRFLIRVGPFPGGFGRPLIVFCLLLGASFRGGLFTVPGVFLAGAGFRQSIRDTGSLRFSKIRQT